MFDDGGSPDIVALGLVSANYFTTLGVPAVVGRTLGAPELLADTPPAITQSISRVVAHADLVLVPTRPSPHDLRAVGATVDMAERHHKPLIFVVNAATLRARITGEAAVALSQHGTVAPITIHHRVDFAASMIDGRTVGEVVPKSASAKEISDLWLYIQDRLSRLKKDEMPSAEATPLRFSVSTLSTLDETDAPAVEAPMESEEFPTAAAKKENEPLPDVSKSFGKPLEEVDRRPVKERVAADRKSTRLNSSHT